MCERKKLPPEPLFDLDCIHCAINQVINTTQIAGTPEPMRRELMQKALKLLSEFDPDTNNCIMIEAVYRMVCEAIGDPDPYRETRIFFDKEMMRLLPGLREHIAASGDPLRAAVRVSIAGNLIDLAALGNEVTVDKALAKVRDVDREGLYTDHCDALAEALQKGKKLLVLGDNCGEIALDRLLVETIARLYPHLEIEYAVRGIPTVNDITYEDAEVVGMQEVCRVIDNGDGLLTTMLCRTSDAFNDAFYGADVIIAKGMGNYEGLRSCDRGDIWFMLIAKCAAISRLTGAPQGSILCLHKAE